MEKDILPINSQAEFHRLQLLLAFCSCLHLRWVRTSLRRIYLKWAITATSDFTSPECR